MPTAFRTTALIGQRASGSGNHARPAAILLIAVLWAAILAGTAVSAFDPHELPARDRERLLEVLEYGQTNAMETLPESGARISVIRTETRPRICRYFLLRGGGFGEQRGVGCRLGAMQWELDAIDLPVPVAPTVPIATQDPPERSGSPPASSPAPTVAPADQVPGVPAVRPAFESEEEPIIALGPASPEAESLISGPAAASAIGAPVIGASVGEPPSAPIPGRRPGTGIPLSAAPEVVRVVPVPLSRPSAGPRLAETGDRTVPAALASVPRPGRRAVGDGNRGRAGTAVGERRTTDAGLPALFVTNTQPTLSESLFTLLDTIPPRRDEHVGTGEAAVVLPSAPRPPELPAARALQPVPSPAPSAGRAGNTGDAEPSRLLVPLAGDRLAALPLPRRRPIELADAHTGPAVPRPAHKP